MSQGAVPRDRIERFVATRERWDVRESRRHRCKVNVKIMTLTSSVRRARYSGVRLFFWSFFYLIDEETTPGLVRRRYLYYTYLLSTYQRYCQCESQEPKARVLYNWPIKKPRSKGFAQFCYADGRGRFKPPRRANPDFPSILLSKCIFLRRSLMSILFRFLVKTRPTLFVNFILFSPLDAKEPSGTFFFVLYPQHSNGIWRQCCCKVRSLDFTCVECSYPSIPPHTYTHTQNSPY